MVFSSAIFLFGFLPIVLLAYYLSPGGIKNNTLWICSLLFYAWGAVFYLMVMIVSIIANYAIGRLIYKYQEISPYKKLGPNVRYHDISQQISSRGHSLEIKTLENK